MDRPSIVHGLGGKDEENLWRATYHELDKVVAERFGLPGARADRDGKERDFYGRRITNTPPTHWRPSGVCSSIAEGGGYVDYLGWKAEAEGPEPCIPVGIVPFEASSREELKKYRLLKLQQSVIPADPRQTLL